MPSNGQTPDTACEVSATVETVPVASSDDAADDPCIWVHPSDPSLSRIIGTDKQAGLAVYALDGSLIQFLPDGKMNNVDVRYGFPLNGSVVDVVTAGNRTTNAIAIYAVDPSDGRLTEIAARKIAVPFDVYGSCMYRGPDGQYFAAVTSKDGDFEQWELIATNGGKIDARMVRRFDVGGQIEGCVADDALGFFYIAEEAVGIWKYSADPSDNGDSRTKVDETLPTGRLTPDVEGLALIFTGPEAGYLVASSQGSNEFMVYRREVPNEFVAAFRVGTAHGIDEVTGTDGIDATSAPLGDRFPQGLLVVQDDENGDDPQNFKLVPLEAMKCVLSTITGRDPRKTD